MNEPLLCPVCGVEVVIPENLTGLRFPYGVGFSCECGLHVDFSAYTIEEVKQRLSVVFAGIAERLKLDEVN